MPHAPFGELIMTTATVEEVQINLPSLISALKPGEEVMIMEHDRAVARLIAEPRQRKLGWRRREVGNRPRRRFVPGRFQRVYAVRLLLDTHAFLWAVLDDPRLGGRARALMLDAGNELLLSPASYWEIAIKVSLGKYTLP